MSSGGTRQFTSWMRELAPLETWERWWGERTVSHQAPLYAYVLAAVRLVAGDGFLDAFLGRHEPP